MDGSRFRFTLRLPTNSDFACILRYFDSLPVFFMNYIAFCPILLYDVYCMISEEKIFGV